MKRRTFVRPEAQADIRKAARWYETREAGLGLRFASEIRESLRRIADSPLRFPIVDKDVRRALLHKFPYSIYFVHALPSDVRKASGLPAKSVHSVGLRPSAGRSPEK